MKDNTFSFCQNACKYIHIHLISAKTSLHNSPYGSSFIGNSFLFPFLLLIFFIFNLCHFSYNVTWCGPFGLILFGIFCGSWTWMCFYSQFKEVFHSYVFKYALCHFLSLSSPSGSPAMRMLIYLMLSQRSLIQCSFFLFIQLQ